MAGFLLRGLVVALGLWAATSMLDGIRIDTPLTLILAGLLLGVVNAVVRPFVLLLSLPALLLTLGLFLLVINAAMLGLVAWLLPGFTIPGGFWSAVAAAIIVSVISWIGSWFIGPRGRIEILRAPREPKD
jgi:putative membrane protein